MEARWPIPFGGLVTTCPKVPLTTVSTAGSDVDWSVLDITGVDIVVVHCLSIAQFGCKSSCRVRHSCCVPPTMFKMVLTSPPDSLCCRVRPSLPTVSPVGGAAGFAGRAGWGGFAVSTHPPPPIFRCICYNRPFFTPTPHLAGMIVTVGLSYALAIVRLQERRAGRRRVSGCGVGLGVKCRKCYCDNGLWFAG